MQRHCTQNSKDLLKGETSGITPSTSVFAWGPERPVGTSPSGCTASCFCSSVTDGPWNKSITVSRGSLLRGQTGRIKAAADAALAGSSSACSPLLPPHPRRWTEGVWKHSTHTQGLNDCHLTCRLFFPVLSRHLDICSELFTGWFCRSPRLKCF